MNGYSELFFQTITGAPSVVSGAVRFNEASAQTSGEYLYGTFETDLVIPTVPTVGDNRYWGLTAVINGTTHLATFNIADDVFTTNTCGASPTDMESTTVAWVSGWEAAQTKFAIKWYKEKVEFWVGGLKVATHTEFIPETRALPFRFTNGNADNMDLVSMTFVGIHKVFGMFGEGTGGGSGAGGGSGTYASIPVRTSAVLTNGYVAGTVLGPATGLLNLQKSNQLILYVDFTIGDLDDALIRVEFSSDGTDYYQETLSVLTVGIFGESVGEHKLVATGKYRITIPIMDKYIKVSSKGTGTVTNSLLGIKALIGNA
jgi:hypothetical protein